MIPHNNEAWRGRERKIRKKGNSMRQYGYKGACLCVVHFELQCIACSYRNTTWLYSKVLSNVSRLWK